MVTYSVPSRCSLRASASEPPKVPTACLLYTSNKYTIYPKEEKKPSASTPQDTSQPEVTPIPGLENLEEVAGAVRSERGDGDTYYCAPIADDRLLDILDEHGVGYEAPYIEQLSPIIEFLLTWQSTFPSGNPPLDVVCCGCSNGQLAC